VLASIRFILPIQHGAAERRWSAKLPLRGLLRLFPEDGHGAVIRFTKAVCFLPDVQTLQFVVVQQMIAGVLELVDSIEFNVAEWTHPGLGGTDSDQLLLGDHPKPAIHNHLKTGQR
jgi:hypothetical protein